MRRLDILTIISFAILLAYGLGTSYVIGTVGHVDAEIDRRATN